MNRLISTLASSFILILTAVNLFNYLGRNNVIYIEESSDKAANYWREVITRYPTFRDGYISLAQIERDKGNLEAARVLLDEAKKLSPNEEDITQISLR